MEVLHPQCAGLDVHKDVVVACARIAADGKVTQDVRSFATTTTALFELSAWLEAHRCTHVVMEATGVYWKAGLARARAIARQARAGDPRRTHRWRVQSGAARRVVQRSAQGKPQGADRSLHGRVTDHHRFLLRLHLAQVDLLKHGMRDLEARMGESLEPFRQHIDNLTTLIRRAR